MSDEETNAEIVPADEDAPAPVNPASSLDPEALIQQAINNGIEPETMQSLLDMRKELRDEKARDAFRQAMTDFQRECPVIEKKKKVMGKNNRKVRYRYAPLDSIINQVGNLLGDHGFSYHIDTDVADGYVKATCEVHHEAGHSETSDFTVPIDEDAYMNAQQKFASALTYAKRYAFCNAFGILTGEEDDDANSNPVSDGSKQKQSSNSKQKQDSPQKGRPNQEGNQTKDSLDDYRADDGTLITKDEDGDASLCRALWKKLETMAEDMEIDKETLGDLIKDWLWEIKKEKLGNREKSFKSITPELAQWIIDNEARVKRGVNQHADEQETEDSE